MKVGPEDIAKDLGLEFTVEHPAQSKLAVLRFTFKFPEDVKSAEYAEVVGRVTRWATRVKAWTFVHPGPLPIVAADLSFGNRFKVAWVNRDTRKKLAAFWGVEAVIRRNAMSQPTPQQALNMLTSQLPNPKDKATKDLMATLRRSIAILEAPDAPGTTSPVFPTSYDYQPPAAAPQSNPFISNQGTGGELH